MKLFDDILTSITFYSGQNGSEAHRYASRSNAFNNIVHGADTIEHALDLICGKNDPMVAPHINCSSNKALGKRIERILNIDTSVYVVIKRHGYGERGQWAAEVRTPQSLGSLQSVWHMADTPLKTVDYLSKHVEYIRTSLGLYSRG